MKDTIKAPARFCRQRGFALLSLLILLLFLSLAFWFRSPVSAQNEARESTLVAMMRAREALLDYAVGNLNDASGKVPGYLPCPDVGSGGAENEGRSPANCGKRDVSVLGRLPWRTLGVEPLRDANGECLWFALSGTFLGNPATDMLNWDTEGLLQVQAADGTTLLAGSQSDNRAVAVIFSPGLPLAGQKRYSAGNAPICGGNYDAKQYLDSALGIDNAQLVPGARGLSRLIAGEKSPAFNDQLMIITAADVFRAIEKHPRFHDRIEILVRDSARCLASFAKAAANPEDRRLPWAASVALDDYLGNASYKDTKNTYLGRLPYNVDQSKKALAPLRQSVASDLLKAGGVGVPCVESVTVYNEWYKNWKDQLFYAVAKSYAPEAALPSRCAPCLKVNDQGEYAGIVFFAGRPLRETDRGESFKQRRNNRAEIGNYLEGIIGESNYRIESKNTKFNDIAWCVTSNSEVVKCP